MAEGTYEYECMRAELLGIEKPDYEEFLKKQAEQTATAEEETDIENLKETDLEDEGMKRISGGLDELNSILQVTQRKINKFKASCGSLTNLLKIKIGHGSSDDSLANANNEANETKESGAVTSTTPTEGVGGGDMTGNGACSDKGPRKSDLAKALDNHVDGLDAMIEKAERAQYSMAHQNKEMKRFLN